MRRSGSTPWKRLLILGCVAVGAPWLVPSEVGAQGSAVYTQSACMTARNGAGIAQPCTDGSAVYYNPAALAHQMGAVSVGATVIDQTGSFIHDTTGAVIERAPRTMTMPHGWAAYRFSDRIGVGLGVFAPYGLAIDWPVCPIDQPQCGTGFEGRFVGYDQSMRGLYLQPTVAYDLLPGRLALGFGLDLVRGDVEIRRRVDLAPQSVGPFTFAQIGIPSGTDFADVTLAGDGWGVTGHLGALLRVTDAISVGARYLHSVELAMEGTADFTQVRTFRDIGPLGSLIPEQMSLDDFLEASGVFDEGGPASDQDISTTITLPAQAVVGVAFELDRALRVMFDYQWTQWSTWDEVDVDFSVADDERLIMDYQDASTYRLGGDYAINDRLIARAGVTYAEAAAGDASVSPFLPDSERAFYSGGFHFRAGERLSFDFFGMTVNAANRRGRVVDRESVDQTAEQLNEGVYSSDGQLFGATLTYHFGGPR